MLALLLGALLVPVQAATIPAFDLQTPWGIKLLSGGPIADKVSYYMYFFLYERGEVVGLEDAYLQFTDIGGSGITAMARVARSGHARAGRYYDHWSPEHAARSGAEAVYGRK